MNTQTNNNNDNNTLLDDDIPEKFRDSRTGEVQMGSFVRSYKALEKRLSSTPSVPSSPQDYCIDCAHGLFSPDAEVNARLHEKGLSEEQVQAVYDLAAEKMVPMIVELAEDFKADHEVERLVNHFGGPDRWKEISRQLLAFGQKNLPADVLDNLSSSYEGVLALHRMMKSNEPGLARRTDAQKGMEEKELQSMMRNPKYWRDKDPAFIEKVTSGFRQIYGGK